MSTSCLPLTGHLVTGPSECKREALHKIAPTRLGRKRVCQPMSARPVWLPASAGSSIPAASSA